MRLTVGKKALVGTILVLSLYLAVLLDWKSYELWPQVTFIWEFRSNPLIEFSNGNPHALRYAIVYPIFALSDSMAVDYDSIFSFVVIGFLLWTFSNVCKTLSALGNDVSGSLLWTSVIGIVLFSLFCLMNGRASFSFLGYSLLLSAMTRFHFNEKVSLSFPFTSLLAVTLCGVTSGTLFSALGAFAIFLFFEIRRFILAGKLSLRIFVALLSGAAIIYSLSDVVLILYEKNITFFGGGLGAFYGMLKHGAGSIIAPIFEVIDPIFVATIAALAALVLYLSIISSRNRFILGIMFVSIALGAFGFTTLSLAALPVTVAVVVYFRGRFRLSYR